MESERKLSSLSECARARPWLNLYTKRAQNGMNNLFSLDGARCCTNAYDIWWRQVPRAIKSSWFFFMEWIQIFFDNVTHYVSEFLLCKKTTGGVGHVSKLCARNAVEGFLQLLSLRLDGKHNNRRIKNTTFLGSQLWKDKSCLVTKRV